MFTEKEKIEMVSLYLSGNSIRSVRDIFAAKYTDKQIPSMGLIQKLVQKFNHEGCINNLHKKRVRQCPVLTENLKLEIFCYVEGNERITLNTLSQRFGVFKSSVHNLLK